MTSLSNSIHELSDRVLDLALHNGWAATLSYRVGLQGRVRLERLRLGVRRAPGAPSLRVGFAADLHAGPVTHPAQHAAARRLLTDAQPDVLLLGGDFVSLSTSGLEALADELGAIPAPLGRFAVLGNHDYRARRAAIVTRALERRGIRMLRNENVRLPAPHDDVWICGLDDVIGGAPDADAMFAGASGTRLVIMHGPDGLIALGDHAFDVAFCGHTHGGQIALPWGTPLVLPGGKLDRRFSRGLHRVREDGRGGHLLVSRGVGCSAIPVRLFAWPEVHLCEV